MAGKSNALPQLNRLSLCATKVLLPTGNQTIEDSFSTGGPNYREFFYTLNDFAGQSQNFDGNGSYFRLQPGGGNILLEESFPQGNLLTDKQNFAFAAAAPIGTQPLLGGKPPKKPNVRCDRNPVPDLNSGLGDSHPPTLVPVK